MPRSLPWRGPALVLAAAVATPVGVPAWDHDDDPKVLDRLPPVRAAGIFGGPGGPGNSPGGFDSHDVTLLAWVPLSLLDNASSGNDCWGYVSPADREYAIIGTSSGTNFLEITDPANPGPVMHVAGPGSLWRDIKTYDHYAFAVSEGGNGIQVIDLANIDSGQVSLVNTVTSGGSTSTHNVALDTDSGFLYRTGGSGHGLRIYDLANPAAPQWVASWDTRYVHDAEVVTYTSGPLAGRQLAFCCGGFNGGWDQTGLTILDVTDKSNITVMDQVYYPNPGYSHQGWLSPDRNYFYLGDELDESNYGIPSTVHVIDVSDPSNAFPVTTFTNGNPAITHNLYTLGDFIYAANYTSGMRVFDATNPVSPVEIAYFDTRPEDDGVSFNGLWSVYPYFPSGTVIGSDLERGLFVWDVGEPPIQIALPNGVPETLDPDGDAVAVTISETNPGDLMLGSELLYYDVGAGFTSLPLVDQGGGSYEAAFPPIPCGETVAWYVEAADSTGMTWTNPGGAPGSTHSSLSAEDLNVVLDHDMESASGWVGGDGGDTATTGVWVRVDPRGTAAQPEDDHTPSGTKCWVTGQGSVGGSLGENDVDGGKTTLLSPVLDLATYDDPRIRYWRWYSNDKGASPNADVFRVGISNDGGSSWKSVEIVGPGGVEASGGWFQHEFLVADVVSPSSQVQLRFIAEDAGDGSIVEAAVDDFQVLETICDGGPGTNYCTSNPNSTGLPGTLSATGSDVVADDDLTLHASQLPANQFGFLIASQTQGFVSNPGGSQGDLCLGGQILRFSSQTQSSGAAGEFSVEVDLTFFPPPYGGPVLPGQTWNFQAWYRDVNPMPTSNFTDGRSVLFK